MRESGCPSDAARAAADPAGSHADRAPTDAAAALLLYAAAVVPLSANSGGTGPLMAGVGAGAVVVGGAVGSLLRRIPRFSTPADRITLARAVLVGLGAVAVVEGLFTGRGPDRLVFAAGSLAFLLDAVDGAVARRTGTASAAGGRLDSATDAALVLVLSTAAAGVVGGWTLGIGAAYYVFTAAGFFLPWLRRPLPRSAVRKTIGALQPFALLLALTPVPRPVAVPVVALALFLLAFSFARDTFMLQRGRRPQPPESA